MQVAFLPRDRCRLIFTSDRIYQFILQVWLVVDECMRKENTIKYEMVEFMASHGQVLWFTYRLAPRGYNGYYYIFTVAFNFFFICLWFGPGWSMVELWTERSDLVQGDTEGLDGGSQGPRPMWTDTKWDEAIKASDTKKWLWYLSDQYFIHLFELLINKRN